MLCELLPTIRLELQQNSRTTHLNAKSNQIIRGSVPRALGVDDDEVDSVDGELPRC